MAVLANSGAVPAPAPLPPIKIFGMTVLPKAMRVDLLKQAVGLSLPQPTQGYDDPWYAPTAPQERERGRPCLRRHHRTPEIQFLSLAMPSM
ncbi:unnamed protein product [Symbiodinium sp. CCMP2592]|nr:unnamed protein product [Symbiodinium sp. CCMP2592]